MDKNIYSISQLTRQIKETLESSFPRLWVEGEISNFKHHSSGHLYFTLKDEDAQIRCAMWRFRAGSLLFKPLDGMKVFVEADLQVYERSGNYQLIVQQMQPAGVGALQMAFEQLKKKLKAEGLFEDEHKKPLPLFPEKIAVVTSPTGAAIRDIVSVIQRRFPGVEILLYPVRVQGPGSAEEISQAIMDLNEYTDIDVMIVGRGGGSLEDLWAFNEEVVARAIFASQVPVISAVGHEIDFSIADFVADRRAATPSAAAEMVVRDRSEVTGQLNYYRQRYNDLIRRKIENYRDRMASLKTGYGFRRPQDLIFQHMQRLDELQRQIQVMTGHRLQLNRNKLTHLEQQLKSINPEAVLKRGYSIVFKDGKILKDTAGIKKDDDIQVKLRDGEIAATVKEIKPS